MSPPLPDPPRSSSASVPTPNDAIALARAAGLGIAVRDFPDDVAAAYADAVRTLAALAAPPNSDARHTL